MDEVVVCDFVFTFDFYLTKKEPTSDNVEEELTEEEREQAEIERHFGPVDEKQQDVEQVYVFQLVFVNLEKLRNQFQDRTVRDISAEAILSTVHLNFHHGLCSTSFFRFISTKLTRKCPS